MRSLRPVLTLRSPVGFRHTDIVFLSHSKPAPGLVETNREQTACLVRPPQRQRSYINCHLLFYLCNQVGKPITRPQAPPHTTNTQRPLCPGRYPTSLPYQARLPQDRASPAGGQEKCPRRRCVRFDLPPVRPNGLFGPCSRALIGDAQPYMVGGPPSHSAIKERWGSGLAVRGSPRRQSPHRHPNPNPILRRGAASDGKYHRRRQRHPDAHTAAEDATAPTLPLHQTSLPARR